MRDDNVKTDLYSFYAGLPANCIFGTVQLRSKGSRFLQLPLRPGLRFAAAAFFTGYIG